MLELFFDWTYNIQHTPMDIDEYRRISMSIDETRNIQHTPMNIDENGTYNIKHIIYTDEYRWVLMRRGTYNIKHKIYTDEYRWNKEHTTISFINISGWFLFLLRTWNLLNWSVLPMFQGDYMEHTIMNIDETMKQIIILAWCSNYSLIEHITYNIHRWISTNIDEYRWVLMRRGTYNIHRWISMRMGHTT